MKISAKNIKKLCRALYRAVDVSPHSYGRLKVLIYIMWGLNALTFFSKDTIFEHQVSTEVFTTVSREVFDYSSCGIASNTEDVDIILFFTGTIENSPQIFISCDSGSYKTSRAPPSV